MKKQKHAVLANDILPTKENAHIFSWLENNLEIIDEKLTLIEGLVFKQVNDDNFNVAINTIHFIVDKIPLMASFIDPTVIIRARPNYGNHFSKESEISYNSSNIDAIAAGRFNRPREALFYGGLRVDNPKTDHVLSSMLESCKELVNEYNAPQVQDLTVGKWLVKTTIPIINLCFDERHLEGNKTLKDATEQFKSKIHNYFSSEAASYIERFLNFFSSLSCDIDKNKNSYYILEAFFTAVRYYYQKTLNFSLAGIIYPGAMSEAKGLNIVLTPEATNSYLQLKNVVMYRFF